MTSKRAPLKRRVHKRITPQAIAAWKEGNWGRLHEALGLHPDEMSPLPNAYGDCSETPPPETHHFYDSWPLAIRLQRELFAIAGQPGTEAH